MDALERQTVQQQAVIESLQARTAQMENLLHQAHNNAYLWQQRAYQAQHHLPSLANAMAQLPMLSEHAVLPTQPGWGQVQFGTINPQQVNSTPATFTQEDEVDLEAAMANFA